MENIKNEIKQRIRRIKEKLSKDEYIKMDSIQKPYEELTRKRY